MAGLCSKCRKLHDRNGRYCVDCHAAYMRTWRETHKLGPDQRKRDNARSYAGTLKRRGQLVPEPCKVCGSAQSEMHHPDHELPRLVVWLCRPCHLAWHAHWRLIAKQTFERWLASSRIKRAA